MDRLSVLVAELNALLSDLDVDGADLASTTVDLQQNLLATVASYASLRLVLMTHGIPVTLTVVAPTDGTPLPSVTSLRLPLGWLPSVDDPSVIIFFATTAGAFVDLAADLAYVLGPRATVVLDDDGIEPLLGPAPALSGVDDLMRLDQAAGMLVAEGYDLLAAGAELVRRAAVAKISLAEAAQRQLAG